MQTTVQHLFAIITMTLAKLARTEEPKPYSLHTRTEVDEWILPPIDRADTMHSVLDRYVFIFLYLSKFHLYFSMSSTFTMFKWLVLYLYRIFEVFDKEMMQIKRDRMYLEKSFASHIYIFLWVLHLPCLNDLFFIYTEYLRCLTRKWCKLRGTECIWRRVLLPTYS